VFRVLGRFRYPLNVSSNFADFYTHEHWRRASVYYENSEEESGKMISSAK